MENSECHYFIWHWQELVKEYPLSYLQWQPADCEDENDDCDELHHSLLGLHGLYVEPGPTRGLLEPEIIKDIKYFCKISSKKKIVG